MMLETIEDNYAIERRELRKAAKDSAYRRRLEYAAVRILAGQYKSVDESVKCARELLAAIDAAPVPL